MTANKKHASLKDIASYVGVSTSLVSFVLNGKGRLHRVIGVVISDISNPFFSSIARYLEDEAEKYGYSILFSSSDENRDRSESQIAHLINRGVDGLILVPGGGFAAKITYGI